MLNLPKKMIKSADSDLPEPSNKTAANEIKNALRKRCEPVVVPERRNDDEFKAGFEKPKSSDVMIKTYLQSYLFWMSKQNPSFASTCSPDEISNYFFHSISHPLWFMKLMEKQSFKMMILIDNYFRKYMNHAELFNFSMLIVPKVPAPYNEINEKPEVCPFSVQGLPDSETKRLTYDELIYTRKLLNL